MKTCIVLIVLSGVVTFANGQFPPFIKLCKRNANINECVKENILVAKKYVKQGIPKLFVLPTNPFIITKVIVDTSTLNLVASNYTANGVEEFEVKDLNIDLENNKFDIDIRFKRLEAECGYKMDGKLVGIPLKAAGTAIGNMTNMALTVSLSGKRFRQNEKTFINFDERKVKLTFDTCYLFFKNLFPNRELTEVANRVFNDNIKDVIGELQQVIEETFAAIISQSVTKLFAKYSVDELFPL